MQIHMLFKNYVLLVFFSPLLLCFLNFFGYKILKRRGVFYVSLGILVFYFVSSFVVFYFVVIAKEQFSYVVFQWFTIGNFIVHCSLFIDSLVSSMFLIIAIVSFAVHIYSFGYMSSDKNMNKFIAILSLFTFLMTVLISADNFLQLFLGWEGVGVCSYLLIGYYNEKNSAAAAAMKAFIVNRVSDFAFLIAIIVIYVVYHSLDFSLILQNISPLSEKMIIVTEDFSFSVLEIICFLLLFAAMGKSAQIGFHVWLPDAMEGPTPVSALIHSATMVTAGVFLLVKTSFLFEQTEYAIKMILIVGCCTVIFGSIVAIAQSDIKKIIAYSTCSQLGYMFCACGLAGYNIAIFHLMTHGFFKSMLFLCAGNIIYSTGKQDIFKLGGMRSVLKNTHVNFLFASLALSGIFPMAGFYSKDLIVELAFASKREFANFSFYLLLIAIFFTSLYSFKIITLVFYGKKRFAEANNKLIKEPGYLMQIPIYILLIGTLFSGKIFFYLLNIDGNYYFGNSMFHQRHEHGNISQYIQMLPMITSLLGIFVSILIYQKRLYIKIAKYCKKTFYALKNALFIEQFYNKVIVKTIKSLAYFLHKIDIEVIDKGGPRALSQLTKAFGQFLTHIHTGYLVQYIIFIIISITAFLVLFIAKYMFLIS